MLHCKIESLSTELIYSWSMGSDYTYLLLAIDLSVHREGEAGEGERKRGRIHSVDNHGPKDNC